MRPSGIDVVGSVPWGTHFCQFYDTGDDLVETLVPYFREGLMGNEYCLWIACAPLQVEQARATLQSAVPDLERRIARGQLEILDCREWYTPGGRFDIDTVLRGWWDRIVAALDRGFQGLRVSGNTFWLESADWADCVHYEEALNEVIGAHPVLGMCSYSLSKCGAAEIFDVVANHEFTLIKRSGRWQRIESAHYQKMEQALRESEARVAAAQEELRAANDQLHQARQALRRSEERLLAADRRKDEFLAMLAHELRNPLAAICSAVQLMQARRPSDPVLQRAQNVMARQAQHTARILDDLLDISRITEGKIVLKKETLALAPVLESALESARPILEDRGHQVFVAIPRETLVLDADPVRLAQAVSNLLNNAAKYTPSGGEIHLSAQRHGSEVAIRVRDNGIGIAPEVLPTIFDLFVQGEHAPGRRHGGLGIGLTMVQKLVAMHGGRVEARSEGPGRGSEFVVWLPLAEVETEHHARRSEPRPLLTPRRILIADDNADAAEMLAALLEEEGHWVFTAEDGPSAIGRALSEKPDVILLDIGMPGMDGYTVARRLRLEPALEGTMLVAVTGYGQDEDRERAFAAGFEHHLVKPVDLDALRRVIAASPTPAWSALSDPAWKDLPVCGEPNLPWC